VVNAVLPYKKLSTPDEWGCFELRTPENMMPNKPALAAIKLPFLAPNQLDMVFALQLIQFTLQNRAEDLEEKAVNKNIQANAKNLQGKTLMLDKAEFKEDDFPEEKVKKSYPYEYVVENRDTIGSRTLNGNADFAYIMIAPGNDNNLQHYVMSCEDGTVCCIYSTPFNPKQFKKDRINLEALKAYSKFAK
jgi:hypothetical protein